MSIRNLSLALLTGLALSTQLAQAQNLTNGSFASYTGDVPTGWTTLATSAQEQAAGVWSFNINTFDRFGLLNAGGNSMSSAAAINCNGANSSTTPCNTAFNDGFKQTVTGLRVGDTYAISFWTNGLRALGGGGYDGTPMGWDVTFGGMTQQGVRAPTTTQSGQYGAGNFAPWVQTTLSFVASSESQLLSFASKIPVQGAPQWSILALGNVTITDVTPVPEPAAWALMLAGIAGFAMLRRRQKTAD